MMLVNICGKRRWKDQLLEEQGILSEYRVLEDQDLFRFLEDRVQEDREQKVRVSKDR
jgi:hypothetical protein